MANPSMSRIFLLSCLMTFSVTLVVGRHAFHPMMGHVEAEQALERADGVPAANARETVPVPQELEEVVSRLLPRGGEENTSDAVLELGTLGGIR